MSKVTCAMGEQLTAPWAFIQFDMDESNNRLLTEEQRKEVTARSQALTAKRICLEHWLQALDMVEQFVEGKQLSV